MYLFKKIVLWKKNNVGTTTSIEEFLKYNSQNEDEKLRRASNISIKKTFIK